MSNKKNFHITRRPQRPENDRSLILQDSRNSVLIEYLENNNLVVSCTDG